MEPIFNLFKVKFKKMDELFSKHCSEMKPDSTVNLYINLECVMRKLYSSGIEDYLKVKKEDKIFEMISCIFNLAAHYRLFFKKNKMKSKIYIYVPTVGKHVSYKNQMINAFYRESFNHKHNSNPKYSVLNKTLKESIPFIKTILQYINGVYLIEGDKYETSLIPYTVNEEHSADVSVILTNDKYEYQYTNIDSFYLLIPKKEESYIVSKSNVIENFKLNENVSNDLSLHPTYLSTILAMLGDKHRDIPKLKKIGLATILRTLVKAQEKNILGEQTNNPKMVMGILNEEYQKTYLSNFYCTDISVQYKTMNTKDTENIYGQLKDKFDNMSLKKINDSYFTLYPLYLLEIQEETYSKTKKIIKF